MNRKFSFTPGQFYHLYNQGTDQREIFSDSFDYHRFMSLLYLCNSGGAVNFSHLTYASTRKVFEYHRGETIVAIGGYCLMPNHFHLLVKETSKGGISKFMSRLGTAYAMYYNSKYGRKGNLYAGPFKASPVTAFSQLDSLLAYIHAGPAKLLDEQWSNKLEADYNFLANYISAYSFSSLPDYLNSSRPQKAILNLRQFKATPSRTSPQKLLMLAGKAGPETFSV